MKPTLTTPIATPLILLLAVVSGCNFEPDLVTLEVPEAPPAPQFGELPPADGLPPVEPEEAEDLPIEPVEVAPEVQPLCTTVYLNLRPQPNLDDQEGTITMPPWSEVAWSGEEVVADGHTWYQVSTSAGAQGWASSQYMLDGACADAVFALDGVLPIVESPNAQYENGNQWLDPDANTEHFGMDFISNAGNPAITSPYSDQIAASDPCPGCTEVDLDEGNTPDESDPEYNYGYGAMIVVEYAYSDLSDQERSHLERAGVSLSEGESVYMMMSHLDPNVEIAEAGTVLESGSQMASIGNSGNSSGAHGHLEMAVAESGLTQAEGEATADFWLDTVVERSYRNPEQSRRQGNRVDPSGLFD